MLRTGNQGFKPQMLVALLKDIHGTPAGQPKSLAWKAASTSLLCCDNFFPRRLRTISKEKWQETVVAPHQYGVKQSYECRRGKIISNPAKLRLSFKCKWWLTQTSSTESLRFEKVACIAKLGFCLHHWILPCLDSMLVLWDWHAACPIFPHHFFPCLWFEQFVFGAISLMKRMEDPAKSTGRGLLDR